jgi:hypothetical protein
VDLLNAPIGTDCTPPLAAITCLSETGQISVAVQQECVLLNDVLLLGDVLGGSMLVDALKARVPAAAAQDDHPRCAAPWQQAWSYTERPRPGPRAQTVQRQNSHGPAGTKAP